MPDDQFIEELRAALRYDPDTGKLFWNERPECPAIWNAKHANKEAFTYVHKHGYKVGTFLRRSLRAHRVIWAIVHGEWPEMIDHINGDKEDNRLSNLRSVSMRENMRNKSTRKDNKSGVNGVCWESTQKRWLVQIATDGRTKYIGVFQSLEDARRARHAAEVEYGYHENHGRAKADQRKLSKRAQEKRR